MIKTTLFFVFCICCAVNIHAQSCTVSGYITDAETKEALIGATVVEKQTRQGYTSNNYGFYSFKIPGGDVKLTCSFLGYEELEFDFVLTKDTTILVELRLSPLELAEVTVTARHSNLENVRLGTAYVPLATVRNMPALLGESDLMKSLQFVPGVQNTSEGKSDLSVRGGTPDQNLVLLDGIPVYSTSHVFGFLSIFNTDALKNVTLYKSAFPARFGGRLSSVVDIATKDGNKERFTGSATLGLLSAKINLEGPLIKDRTSFTFSARRSFADLFMGKIQEWTGSDDENPSKAGFFFYDLNAKLHHKLTDRTSVYLMAYNGNDRLENTASEKPETKNIIHSQTRQNWKWGNTIVAAKLNHAIKSDLFVNAILSCNQYNYNTSIDKSYVYTDESWAERKAFNGLDYDSGIRDYSAGIDMEYFPANSHLIRTGGLFVRHDFRPEIINKKTNEDGGEDIDNNTPRNTIAEEFAFYAEDDWDITKSLKVNYGIRFSSFHVNKHTYRSVDPRLSLRYLLSPRWSVKAGYSRMQQYIHLLSSNSLILQTDLWVSATDRVKPMDSRQYSIGMVWAVSPSFEFSVESYYKHMGNVIEYRDGASFAGLSTGWESKVEAGRGRAYGVEFFLEKKAGSLTGTLSYALAKTERRFNEINYGEWFPAKFDHRHNINLNLAYKLNRKVDFMFNWTYSSGDRVTIPYMSLAIPDIPGRMSDDMQALQLDHRNNYHMGAYHRLDVGMNYYTRRKGNRYGVFNFSVYNAYNRMNPYILYAETHLEIHPDGTHEYTRKLKQLTLFPIMPSISYTYNF
ncbi:MAG: TonB-dependent receptor [Tannerella sp.]|jgi:outer membrane receptor for ferrienterochelin and colicin|nr:TonB-dependent receptor [Tannerella sp.]